MFRKVNFQIIAILCFVFTATMGIARDYIIYSIAQDIPMGYPNEKIKKNYYINMGTGQGVESGTILDVYRVISRLDPYETKTRYNHRVKIGEIEVIHSEGETAIGALTSLRDEDRDPLFEVKAFMIGDQVEVNVKN